MSTPYLYWDHCTMCFNLFGHNDPIVLMCADCLTRCAAPHLAISPFPSGTMIGDSTFNWPDHLSKVWTSMQDSPEFRAIWDCIKTWDVNVPAYYHGYCGANGSHVAAILHALHERGIICLENKLLLDMQQGEADGRKSANRDNS
jgi:hypothetical protein